MKAQRFLPSCLSVLTTSLMLAACGGGGGGGSGGMVIEPPASNGPLTITSNNYQNVAVQAVSSGSYLMDAGAGNVLGADAQTLPQPLQLARGEALRLAARFAQSGGAVVLGATTTVVQSCNQGGSIEVTVNDANSNQNLDAGDSMSLKAQSCRESGVTMDGSMEYAVKAATGNYGSSQFSATLGVKLNGLRVTSPAGSQTGQGEFQMTVAVTSTNSASVTMSIPSFVTSSTMAGTTVQSTLTGYNLSVSTVPSGFGYRSTLTFSGKLSSTALEAKEITVSTPVALVQESSRAYPGSGQVLVKGGNGSQVRITAQSDGKALVELDANGDNVFETSTVKNWADLRG